MPDLIYSCACIGQVQEAGCLPTRLPVLLRVLHVFSLRARVSAATHLSTNSGRCSSRWACLLCSSRLSGLSFSLFRSLWWTPNPAGIGPCSASQIYCARSIHVLGSAILTKALCSPFRLCRVRILTEPTGYLIAPGIPSTNLPCMSLISRILSHNYTGGNAWIN